MRTLIPLLALALLAIACSAGPPPTDRAADRADGGGGAGGAPPLLASLQATTAGDRVRLALQVTNTTDRPIELGFNSGQRYDFAVLRDGRELWRWGADMMFTQALGSETLAPGATLTYEESWAAAGASGELTAVGRLTSSSHPLEQRTTFRLP